MAGNPLHSSMRGRLHTPAIASVLWCSIDVSVEGLTHQQRQYQQRAPCCEGSKQVCLHLEGA